MPRRVRPCIRDSSRSGLQKLGYFGASATKARLHSLCKRKIMAGKDMIKNRKMSFDMNPLRPFRSGQEWNEGKFSTLIKSRRNQQRLASPGFYIPAAILQEIDQFLPSGRRNFKTSAP